MGRGGGVVECQFDLFDKVVVPVLIYGSEVWGFENLDLIERFRLKFLKYVLSLKFNASVHGVWRNRSHFYIL